MVENRNGIKNRRNVKIKNAAIDFRFGKIFEEIINATELDTQRRKENY